MKVIKRILTIIFITTLFLSQTPSVEAESTRTVVYFKETYCLVCAELAGLPDGPIGPYYQDQDYLYKIENDFAEPITVITYDILIQDPVEEYSYTDDNGQQVSVTANDIFNAYNETYGNTDKLVPVIFAGDTFYSGMSDIKNAVDSGEIYEKSAEPLLEIDVQEGDAYQNITGFIGFLTVLFAGLLDGVNPCAIALLLLFVSLLGFSDNKRFLILVSVVYIFALFVSYLLIGTVLLNVLDTFQAQAHIISTVINWVVAIICVILFSLNMYDYFRAKNDDYGNIKNQLPKFIQRYNKKIVKAFTNVLNSEDKKGVVTILIITFILGITLSLTELVCTGQIYFSILYGIHTLNSVYGYIALIAYNIMFVVPLIIIAVISIKGRGIMETSNYIREHLDLIKLLNALLFLGIGIFYFTRIF
jgi:cytochrome c biogenesis protein CcdA